MADKDERKNAKATRLLFGVKDAEVPPSPLYRRGLHLTPGGTSAPLEPTPEARKYMNQQARDKAADALARSRMETLTPRVPPKAKSQERIIRREPDMTHGKMAQKDKSDDFER